MIYTEKIEIRGRRFIRTYSDTYQLERDGMLYSEAIDPIDSGRVYMESDTLLETGMTETEQKAAAYDILMGVKE